MPGSLKRGKGWEAKSTEEIRNWASFPLEDRLDESWATMCRDSMWPMRVGRVLQVMTAMDLGPCGCGSCSRSPIVMNFLFKLLIEDRADSPDEVDGATYFISPQPTQWTTDLILRGRVLGGGDRQTRSAREARG